MQEHLLWLIAGAAIMGCLLLAPRLARRGRKGIDLNAGRRYEWAKDGEI